MSRVCPHLACIVAWEEDETRFFCACHAGVLNKKGEVLAGPIPRPLDLFPMEIVEGEIIVDTTTPILRDRFEESQMVS